MRNAVVAIKSFFAFIGITFFLFVLLEVSSYAFLKIHYGINPLQTEQEIYSQKISGYYVSKNSPCFTLNTFNGLNNFEPDKTVTDSNGFIVDQPFNRIKPANTIRIFLIGGSTAFGFIQSQDLVDDKTYPAGVYDYPSSICGLLKKKLQQKFPGKKFEVINAAIPMHLFHQGYLQYLALLHDFNPDIIINIDGNNDGGSISTGMPFKCAEDQELDNLIALKAAQPRPWPFSLFLIKYYRDRNYSRAHAKFNPPPPNFTEADYLRIEPELIQKSGTFLWSINAYENQLKSDNVYSVFVLQPLLHRTVFQKKLTLLEKRLLKNDQKSNLMDMTDPAVRKNIAEFSGNNYINFLGSKMPQFLNIVSGYYYDRYFSARADSIVTGNGMCFIDMNKEIVSLPDTTEFYVDYCHLTPFGNEFTAQKLLAPVAKYILQKDSI